MDQLTVSTLLRCSDDEACRILIAFNTKHQQSFSFPEFDFTLKKNLFDCLLDRLEKQASCKLHVACLETLRIVSREKQGLGVLSSEHSLNILINHAGLTMYASQMGEDVVIHTSDNAVVIEAQKCLCNIIYNSPEAQVICSSNKCIEGIIQRMKTYKDPDLAFDIKYYDLRILFLLTLLVQDTRLRVVRDLHGLTYLIEVLDLTMREELERSNMLSDKQVDVCCEILKILFNITVPIDRNNLDEEEEAHCMRLVSILHDLLVSKTASKEKKEELTSNTVNLLTSMPRVSYEELLAPISVEESAEGGPDHKDVEYDGKNMEAIVALLEFLELRLDSPKQNLKESLIPLFHCLCEICRSNRAIRKFCRLKVLPYLRSEVKALPEEGGSLRNKLVRLFTSPCLEVKDTASDFCFILCKENVGRFIKYTGYGNAAGLLAQRGLLSGNKSAEYSSESEDSETEEYAELKDQVNPVTGRWELPKPNPTEGMTDEQKEYEAMELVKKLDQLQRCGAIQPATIGADGRPRPVDHVLELIDKVNSMTGSGANDEDDNDD